VRVGAARQKLPHTEKEELFPNWRSRQGSVRFGAVRCGFENRFWSDFFAFSRAVCDVL
jgi:hypothetical protein